MENPPLGPLEQALPPDSPEYLTTKAETRRPPLVSPEQLQQLGKEAYQAVVDKDGEQAQKSRFEELSENYFEKRHEKLNEPKEQTYSGELTPVGEILSKRTEIRATDNLEAQSEPSDLSAHHGARVHSLATDYKRILAAAIITGVILAIVAIIWLAR